MDIRHAPILKRGSRGEYVADLQLDLASLCMYSDSVDGIFGPNTEAAVRRYQRKYCVDGIVDHVLRTDIRERAERMPDGSSDLPVPHGLSEIIATFGVVEWEEAEAGAIQITNDWERQCMTLAFLPIVGRLYVHRLIEPAIRCVFGRIDGGGHQDYIKVVQCFHPRHKRHDRAADLSAHTWGIAFDVNPSANAYGTDGDMPEEVVAAFKDVGFIWGGDWNVRDPMHFQYCRGY